MPSESTSTFPTFDLLASSDLNSPADSDLIVPPADFTLPDTPADFTLPDPDSENLFAIDGESASSLNPDDFQISYDLTDPNLPALGSDDGTLLLGMNNDGGSGESGLFSDLGQDNALDTFS